MAENADSSDDRLAALERRIAALELRLSSLQAASPPLAQTAGADQLNVLSDPGTPAKASRRPPPLPRQMLPAALPVQAAPASAHEFAPSPMSPHLPARQLPEQETPPLSYASKPLPKPLVQGQFERTLGLKWAGWAGALVLVVGAGLGVKFVYDQRWLARVPAGVWLACIYAIGLGLVGVGEFVYRRVHVIPAASIFGAGVATLFVAGYAGFRYYELYPPTTALVLMTAAAIFGALVAMRGNLVSIAVLSLVGGTIAPLLVSTGQAPTASLLSYLLTLQIVAMVLTYWGQGRKWWTLRGLSLAGNAFWMVVLILDGRENPSLLLDFTIVSAALCHAELLLSVIRRRADGSHVVRGAEGIAFSILVTAGLTAVLLWATQSRGTAEQTGYVLALAAVCRIIAWGLGRMVGPPSDRGAVDAPQAGFIPLSLAYRISTAALLAVAVPTALRGLRIEIGWAILAVAFAVVGVVTRTRMSRYAAVFVWILAVLHLALNAAAGPILFGHAPETWLVVVGTRISSHAIMAWGLAIIGQLIAALLSVRSTQNDASAGRIESQAPVLSAAASAVWLMASLNALPPLGATGSIVLWVWLIASSSGKVPNLRLSVQAGLLLILAAGKWVAMDSLYQHLDGNWQASNYRPVFNLLSGMGVLLAFSMVALERLGWIVLTPRREIANSSPPRLTSIALVILILTATFEIDRTVDHLASIGPFAWSTWQAKLLAWTVAWIISAVLALVYLRHRRPNESPLARWPQLLAVTIVLLAVKYLLVDTLFFRLLDAPVAVRPVVNLEAGTGAVVLASLMVMLVTGLPVAFAVSEQRLRPFCQLLSALVALWIGSLEIDRAFAAARAAARPEQVTLSIFWACLAVVAVVIGFAIHACALRFFGLILLAATLLKVVLIDMSQVETGYRILSFLGLGLLLLATSVLYGKLSPRLLKDERQIQETTVESTSA